MKVKVESEKVGLKLNIQKTKLMASGPTTSWEIKGPLAPWMGPTKFPEIPVSLERNTEVFGHPLL